MRFFATAAFALLAALPRAAAANDCPPLTKVGVSDLGYASYQVEGKNAGASVDIIGELARRSGCQLQIVWYPRGRMLNDFEAGRIDVAMGSVHTDARDQYASFMPYSYTQFTLLLSTRVATKYASLAEFIDRGTERLNLARGVVYSPDINAQLTRLAGSDRVELVNDFDVVFRKIMARRADATIAPAIIYAMHLKRLGIADQVVALPIPEGPRQLVGMYVSHKSVAPTARALFAATLRAMVEDGTTRAIYGRYLDPGAMKVLFKDGLREIVDAISPE